MAPLSLFNPWVLLSIGGALIASNTATHFLSYSSGVDDTRAAQTKYELNQANLTIAGMKAAQAKSDKEGQEHDTRIVTNTNTTRIIERSVQVPANAGFVPVWLVRLWDRGASGNPAADPYPGQPDDAPSDITMSEAGKLLVRNFSDVCRANAIQLADLQASIRRQKEEASAPADKASRNKTLFERLF